MRLTFSIPTLLDLVFRNGNIPHNLYSLIFGINYVKKNHLLTTNNEASRSLLTVTKNLQRELCDEKTITETPVAGNQKTISTHHIVTAKAAWPSLCWESKGLQNLGEMHSKSLAFSL